MRTSSHQSFETLEPSVREAVAENMKERIYASITLLAVIAALWQTSEHHTIRGAVVAIVGSAVALLFATLISARLSHRAIHGTSISPKQYQRTIFTSAGLLAPAIAPTVIILFSGTGWYTLRAALMASMVVILGSLFLISFNAGRRIYSKSSRALIVSLLEVSVGLLVILLKLAVGE